MAQISGTNSERIFPIKAFLGVNEAPDGDTKLKMGEAAVCRNWRVTRDGNLQRRPGLKTFCILSDGEPVRGLWTGYVQGRLTTLAACDDKLWEVRADGTKAEIGLVETTGRVFIFGFSSKAYILNGERYRVYDGETLSDVADDAYVPLYATGIGPDLSGFEGGTLLEQVNKLSPHIRVWLSPDGSHKDFTLPANAANGLDSVEYVKTTDAAEREYEPGVDYTVDTETGKIMFTTAPAGPENFIEVGILLGNDYSEEVDSMQFAELYNGATDTRVILYGDGSNELFYSGMDYNGQPRADYFPDMNEIAVGDSNTPITGAIRHYSRLIVFKLDSTWTVSQTYTNDVDGNLIASYYVVPANRAIGNVAPGQVQLVMNSPISLFGKDCYEWKNNSSYSSNLTQDERQAKRISDRIHGTLRSYDLPECICWDDNDAQEYYIVYKGQAVVHNYAVDAWYMYENFDAVSFCNRNQRLVVGTSDGVVKILDEKALDDDGAAIDAYWESGSIDFSHEWMRKYTSTLWISAKPMASTKFSITLKTDKKTEYAVKTVTSESFRTVAHGLEFDNMEIGDREGEPPYDEGDEGNVSEEFIFGEAAMTLITKVRLKAKKFAYYKLILTGGEAGTTATVLTADMRVRETGYVK